VPRYKKLSPRSETHQMHIRTSPKPLISHDMGDMFADHVEIATERLTIPSGVWDRVTPTLIAKLRLELRWAKAAARKSEIREQIAMAEDLTYGDL
jgi:hypothetical protein